VTFNPGGLKSTAIGAMVGLAVGGVASLVMFANSHNFFLDVGSPAEMVLQQPLSLERDRVAAAITQPNGRPAPAIAKRPQPGLQTKNALISLRFRHDIHPDRCYSAAIRKKQTTIF